MELTTINGEQALQVRGITLRDDKAAIMPIGKLAKLVGVKTPKEIADSNASEDEKTALKALYKAFQKEYNTAREQAFKQNDAAAAVAGKEFAAKGFRLVTDKAGNIIGANVQYRKPNAKTTAQLLADAQREARELRAKIAELTASKTDKQ